MKKIVILGGGFGGVYTAIHLEKILKKYRDSVESFLLTEKITLHTSLCSLKLLVVL